MPTNTSTGATAPPTAAVVQLYYTLEGLGSVPEGAPLPPEARKSLGLYVREPGPYGVQWTKLEARDR